MSKKRVVIVFLLSALATFLVLRHYRLPRLPAKI